MSQVTNGIRWAGVTFSLGITNGVIGHYFDGEPAFLCVLFMSVIFAAIGAGVISEDKP